MVVCAANARIGFILFNKTREVSVNIEKLKAAFELLKLMDGDEGIGDSEIGSLVGNYVIVRTYSAGVWYGLLATKSKNEVILTGARRLWYWQAKKSISLSAVVNYGLKESESRIAPAVEKVWLEAIEIIPVTKEAKKSIEGCEDAEAR